MKFEPSWRFTIIIVAVLVFAMVLVYQGHADLALEIWRDIMGLFGA